MKHRVLIPDVEHQSDMTVQEHIYRRLRSALVLGHFSPGKPVTIRGLATALETSPTPVREALRPDHASQQADRGSEHDAGTLSRIDPAQNQP